MTLKNSIISLVISVFTSLVVGSILGFQMNDLKLGITTGIFSLIGFGLMLLIFYLFKVKNDNFYLIFPVLISIVTYIIMELFGHPAIAYSIYKNAPRQIPFGILVNFERWSFQADIMRLFYNVLAVIGTGSSIIVAMRVKDDGDKLTRWIAFTAAFTIGIISAFNFGDKANNFRNAWREMHTAILRYEADSTYTINNLIDEYEKAEKLVGDVKPDPR